MIFVPLVRPPPVTEGAVRIVVRAGGLSSPKLLRGREVLVSPEGSCFFDEAAVRGSLAEPIYLGRVDDRHCWVSVHDDAPAPGTFTPLREALLTLGTSHLEALSTAAQIATWDELHRHCARCGGPLVARAGERSKTCSVCEIDYYPRIAPCVIVLIHDGRRILLAKKRNVPFGTLIAGFVEAGESLEQAVTREVAEETGARVSDLAYFGSQTWPFPHQMMIGFLARYAGGELRPDTAELLDVGWFDCDAMPPIPPPLSIARRMIEAWLAEVRGPASRD